MYSTLLILHSCWRWLVLASLAGSIWFAYTGSRRQLNFTAAANRWRHWTATILHVQLMIGMALYIISPLLKVETARLPGMLFSEPSFFKNVHLALMLVATVIVTIGSAKAKRETGAQNKYKTMLRWFGLGLFLIFIAIPWPFSPLAGRPLFRSF